MVRVRVRRPWTPIDRGCFTMVMYSTEVQGLDYAGEQQQRLAYNCLGRKRFAYPAKVRSS